MFSGTRPFHSPSQPAQTCSPSLLRRYRQPECRAQHPCTRAPRQQSIKSLWVQYLYQPFRLRRANCYRYSQPTFSRYNLILQCKISSPEKSFPSQVIVIGAGVFGLSTALALTKRHPLTQVTVVDCLVPPVPDGESVDTTGCIRSGGVPF